MAAFAGSALAHHSFAMFDRSKSVVLDGTLKSVQMTNPHAWIVLTVVGPDGVVKDWSIEGPSPNMLIRLGWKRTDFVAGDRVALTANPTKDGSAGGVMVSVRLAGGRELSAVVPPEGVVPVSVPK